MIALQQSGAFMKLLQLIFVYVLCAGYAQADSINRCIDANGKVSYSTTPCPTGALAVKKIEMKNAPSRSGNTAAAADWKKQESEFQNRRNERMNQQWQEEQEIARVKQQEEAFRRQMEESKREAQRHSAENGQARRRLQEDGFPTAGAAPGAPRAP